MTDNNMNFNSTAQGGDVEGKATKQPHNASQAAKSLAEYEIALRNHVEDCIDNEDYDAAWEGMLQLTKMGITDDCYWLALLAFQGYGSGKKDMKAAFHFLTLGAIGGDARCMYWISMCYQHDDCGVEHDEFLSIWWKHKAVELDPDGSIYDEILKFIAATSN